MDQEPNLAATNGSARNVLEVVIRLAAVALLVYWCFAIVKPFIFVLIWGIVIAVAIFPLYRRLLPRVKNRAWLAAIIITGLMLVVLGVPTLVLANIIIDNLNSLAQCLNEGALNIPPPPEVLQTLPLIGPPITKLWTLATTNMSAAIAQLAPHVRTVGGWLFRTAASTGIDVLQFVAAVFVSGFFLARSEAATRLAYNFGRRLAGDRGIALADLAESTVRSVARGIIGTALIQSAFAGIGYFAVGVPLAGLWLLLSLILSIIQIGPSIVMVGVVIWVFATKATWVGILFLIWAIVVALMDNVIKPILFGRGSKVPMVVIFIGAVGGLMHSGILGLFLGSVILALGYKLFLAWLGDEPVQAPRI